VENVGSVAHVLFEVPEALAMDVGSAEQADEVRYFAAVVDARAGVRPGDRVRLAVDPSRIHVFDSETGAALHNPSG
jgi:hypothetical protein